MRNQTEPVPLTSPVTSTETSRKETSDNGVAAIAIFDVAKGGLRFGGLMGDGLVAEGT